MNLQKNIQLIAKQTLINESEAIKRLSDFIDDHFEECIKALLSCNGRIVVTGIGKSANIAAKIVATLNSTGSPAIFLHAADAIHGDLGMVTNDDVVICLSKSGNTPEIKVLVPLLKRIGSKLIALVGNTDSYLANNADYVLNATVEKEACPNNLAPTSSTTAALAIGDAVAVCLMEVREFSKDDFAKRHPGGALGKQLYLKVSDIYSNNELPLVDINASLEEVIMEISSRRLGATAVTENNALVGIVTDGDLRRMLNTKKDLSGVTAKDIMSPGPKTVEKDAYAAKALSIMQEKNITQIIVVDGPEVVGFVHLHDLLKEGLV